MPTGFTKNHPDIPPPRISNDFKMAEVGIIASALQIADIGVRLSLRLYTFGETVASADKSIIAISEHVSLTSTVLKELGQTLDKDQTSRICSPNAKTTADSIVKQCQMIFQELDHVLVNKFANTKSTEKDRRINAAQTLERLKWPFIKGKIDLLMSNLEKQKSTLVLMLNVIALAKQQHERTEPYTIIAEQRSLIEDLAKSNEGYVRKFERLKLSCEEAPVDQELVSTDGSSSTPMPKAPKIPKVASAPAVDASSQNEQSADAPRLDPELYKGSNIPSFSSPDRLAWLMQQYSNLLRTLLREVSAPNYEIAEESRSRIRADIILTQRREMDTLSQVYSPGLPSLGNSRTVQMIHPVTTGSGVREHSGSKDDVDQVSAGFRFESFGASSNSSSSAPSTSSFTNHAKTQPQIPEAQSWDPANDARSGIPPSEAVHGRTWAPAQLHPGLRKNKFILPMSDRTSESQFRRDNSASQSDKPQSTQPESEGGVTPWQQRGRGDSRNQYDDDQSTTLSSREYSDFSGGVPFGVSPSPLSPDRYRFDSEAPTSKIRKHPSSGPTSKWRNDSASRHPDDPQGEPIPQWGNESSNPRSSKRSRISEIQAYAAPATATEATPALRISLSKAGLLTSFQGSGTFSASNVPTKTSIRRHVRTGTRRRRVIRVSEGDSVNVCAENIVDTLLTTWTTLPLHASQINPPRGSLAEAF